MTNLATPVVKGHIDRKTMQRGFAFRLKGGTTNALLALLSDEEMYHPTPKSQPLSP